MTTIGIIGAGNIGSQVGTSTETREVTSRVAGLALLVGMLPLVYAISLGELTALRQAGVQVKDINVTLGGSGSLLQLRDA